ncbi:hypothetical protein D9758_002193 [Tetrapyrgos nigripes]|uniref:Cdc23 domain-containing protein n=1 Tax=Tetrapyrgos nigripes TaxID=182062 RepID=A0A8H5GPB6_9AGAR|nr:hypothetical protein D9758_002193 [Tetrapyrgos nigripes]
MTTSVDATTAAQIRQAVTECTERGLIAAANWTSELLLAIPQSKRNNFSTIPELDLSLDLSSNSTFSTSTPARNGKSPHPAMSFDDELSVSLTPVALSAKLTQLGESAFSFAGPLQLHLSDPVEQDPGEQDALSAARVCIESKEFLRVKTILSGYQGAKARFLFIYSQLLGLDPTSSLDWQKYASSYKVNSSSEQSALLELLSFVTNETEPFLLYLKAVILARLSRREECIEACIRSIMGFEWNWATWSLLSSCIGDNEELPALLPLLPLPPNHPLVLMLHLKTMIDLNNPTDNELELCDRLLASNCFPRSLWIMELRACLLHNLRDHTQSCNQFTKLMQLDPYKIDKIDTYADALFLTDQRTKLTRMALDYLAIDKDRPEVCYLIGNHYAMKADHASAIKFFKRTTQLDPTHTQAWTLLGHEYVETKNSHAAIEAYRRSVDINRKDHRAWYGLGQAYELLNMHQYALHYFHYCTALKPYDLRLWQALGSCYEEMKYLREAIECYKRALIPACPDEIFLNQALARIYRNLGEQSEAVAYHRRIVEVCQAEVRHIAEYAKSSLEVADYELRSPNGNLQIARELLQQVAESNVEEVVRAAEMLKEVDKAIRAR